LVILNFSDFICNFFMPSPSSKSDTRRIKILENTYELPVLAGENLKRIQEGIRERQQAIQSGKQVFERIVEETVPEETLVIVPGKWFGLGKRTERRVVNQVKQRVVTQTKTLNVEERFRTLESQVRDYDQLMGLLKQYKVAYQRFFGQLSQEIGHVIGRKCQEIAGLEQERTVLEQNAQSKQNHALLQMAQQQKRQLLDSLLLMDKAAVLMLKKIGLISQGIQKLTQDSELQKDLLSRLISELEDYKQAYALQKKIQNLQQEIAKMTEVAINFEQYLRDYLGPFQELISDAARVDGDLARTVEEIRSLAEDLMGSEGFFNLRGSDEISESILNFQAIGFQRQDRIEDALYAAQNRGISVGSFQANQLSDQAVAALSIADSIATIQGHVSQRLQGLQSTVTGEPEQLNLGSIELVMLPIPAGGFQMGSDSGDNDEKPIHEVYIPGFYLAETPITQAQYQAIMGANPSHFQDGDWQNRPVENVSWDDAVTFCKKLGEQTGKPFRLPTEAEWEYACRAGTTTHFSFGETIVPSQVNYNGNYPYEKSAPKGEYRNETVEVKFGEFSPNDWGLWQMHGNVWEWCADQWYQNYGEKPEDLKQDGSIAWTFENTGLSPLFDDESIRPLRGGSWNNGARRCRSAIRYGCYQDERNNNYGFRVAASFL
jgi:formylglycine-generating enzyme required for sulfatase activity